MNTNTRRVAVNVGAGYVPGMNAVILGAALTARELGWDLVGVRNGFEGLLSPELYADGGLVSLDADLIEKLDRGGGGALGQSPRADPFHVRRVNEDNLAEEVDLSDHLLETLKAKDIDALISVTGGRGLSILHKLHRKGLNAVCIPRAVENDIAATMVSFGFNSALSFTIEMLDRARQAAQSARQIGVVEVLGERAGWLALQAGIAAGADAVLIPEMPCDLDGVAASLREKLTAERPYGLVVVASGAKLGDDAGVAGTSSLRASLSPLATGDATGHAIQRSGQAAETVAKKLQLMLAEETHPLVLGPWVRGGTPTAVDRQLGLAYGAGAVRALKAGKNGVMVAFHPPDIDFVPLAETINRVRTVPADCELMHTARSLGICVGGER